MAIALQTLYINCLVYLTGLQPYRTTTTTTPLLTDIQNCSTLTTVKNDTHSNKQGSCCFGFNYLQNYCCFAGAGGGAAEQRRRR